MSFVNSNTTVPDVTVLSKASLGIGTAALVSLLNPGSGSALSAPDKERYGQLSKPHFSPKVRRIIYLFQSGGPSHLDLFDYKPTLARMNGEQLPESIRKGQRLTGMTAYQKSFPLAGTQFQFAAHGKSNRMISELLPYTAQVVDELCFVNSMYTEAINHDPAITFLSNGIATDRAPVDRVLAKLWPGIRERQSAHLLRTAFSE